MNPLLRTSILRTMAFCAAHNRAITLLELHGLLVKSTPTQQSVTLGELLTELRALLPNPVQISNGLYVLASHSFLAAERLSRYNDSAILFKKARRYATLLRHVPYIRAAAISGSAALLNAAPQSDIDLLIITAPDRIFTTRFFATVFFQMLGVYRHGEKIAGRFCPNHYIVAGHPLAHDHNLYTAAEYASLIPLFGTDSIEEFWRLNQPWMSRYVLHSPSNHAPSSRRPRSMLQTIAEFMLSPLGEHLEKFLRYVQERRIKKSEYVVVSDAELSFHPGSKGQNVLKRYGTLAKRIDPSFDNDLTILQFPL